MKTKIRKIKILIGIFFIGNTIAFSQGSWVSKEELTGSARMGAVAFSIGDKGYVGTGSHDVDGDISYKDIWQYNPSNNSWTQKADFGGGPVTFAVGFSIGSKGYVGAGFMIDPPKSFWEYNPSTNTWTKKANFPGLTRQWAVGFGTDSKGYIGAGIGKGGLFKDFYEYNPSNNTWNRIANLPTPARYDMVSFLLITQVMWEEGEIGTKIIIMIFGNIINKITHGHI